MSSPVNRIIQWNIRGIRANFEELSLISQNLQPVAICLQETLLKENSSFSFKNHSCYLKSSGLGDQACWGVAVIVNNSVPHRPVTLNTKLQATAVRISLNKTITVCSLYLPPRESIDTAALDDLISQLPKPFLLVGDFNAHNTLWGCCDDNPKGRLLENFFSLNDLCLFNDKSKTYKHPATGSLSSLDLSLSSPDIFSNFSWEVDKDLHGSDHFPVIITEDGPSVLGRPTRWKLHKADWNCFRVRCEQTICREVFSEVEDPTELFTSLIYKAATEAVPRTSKHPKRHNKPWFNDDCNNAIKARKAALRRFDLRPTPENNSLFKIARAKARRVIKESKRLSWRQYVSGLNSGTSVKKTWDMIRKIQGKNSSQSVGHLTTAEGVVTSKKDIANTLADKFAQKSSSDNYSESFQRHKDIHEKSKLNFKSKNDESYNKFFTIKELRAALRKCHDTAAGSDDIHYQLIKQLPNSCLDVLLDVFNNIWETGCFPDSWREAVVIPIPKPGKDKDDPGNYRPIALTSCLCKTMERMINDRLVWFLEKHKLITTFQSGFRKHRGTIDHLVRFETFIREAFLKKEHVVSVFFDLESAYDTTWKYGILKDLHGFGVRGRLAYFISAFLDDRQFRVRVGDTFSDPRDQEMGVPQGSILSVTLFSIKINSIVECAGLDVERFLYVDDFCVAFRSKNMHTIERKLQQVLNNLQTWSDTNGFKFSKSKTKCMHFCQRRKHHPDPDLYLNGTRIEVVPNFKFLGLIFDSRLTFRPHIKSLKDKCQKALNLLRVVSRMDWGADKIVLLRLYRALVRSKLDYGCIVYGSARKNYLSLLDPIHHQGLRLALGAFRTSPRDSLCVEANEPSLDMRRRKLAMQYYLKLKSNPGNPTYNSVFNPLFAEGFLRKEKVVPPFGIRYGPDMAKLDFKLSSVANISPINDPPWALNSATFIYDLASDKKNETNPLAFKTKYCEIKRKYYHHDLVFTDGSKDGNRVAAAAIVFEEPTSERLPDHASIFSAELRAIQLAIDKIEEEYFGRYIIFTDSMSAMQALEDSSSNNPFVTNIISRISRLFDDAGVEVVFCWIPSHIGIHGNERADRAAKDALSKEVSPLKLPSSDFKPLINTSLQNSWQSAWNDPKNACNKLHSIKPTLGEWPRTITLSRREEVILSRLHIGHTWLTHSYLLRREDRPECIPCFAPFTIRHLLVDCIDVAPARDTYFRVRTLDELFKSVPLQNVFNFLKTINIFKKI